MKTNDINKLKGDIKSAALSWVDSQIDCLLPNKATGRAILKNAANNIVAKYDARINEGIDAAFLLFADSKGNIDSDTVVDSLCSMLEEMNVSDFSLGAFEARIGKGEICVDFPRSFFSELIAGDIGGVKITTDDIKQIKNFLK